MAKGKRASMDRQDQMVKLTIPAKAEYITLGRLALTAIARVRPFSDETLSDLKLALTEACTNSVRHAYREGRAGTVEILYQIEPDRLVVEVADDGQGFEPADLSGGGNGDLSEGGLGIAIIRAVSDEVMIDERESGGSRLRFVKFLAE
jgi:serine/threonine-protein kinase RsbW